MPLLIDAASKNKLWLIILIAVSAGVLFWIMGQNSPPSPRPSGVSEGQSNIDTSQILSGGPGKDGIPSIDNPKFWTREEANKFLKDDDIVLGLEFEGEARAYPLKILNWHEIVNDVINNKPILITYCPLCYTGIAFEREINGAAVEFGVSGKLYNNNLLMYNRGAEESLWSQQLGEAVVGPLTGTKLKQIISDTLTWSDWKKKHPATLVLSTQTGHSRNYNANPYGNYEFDQGVIFPLTNDDTRLPRKTKVYGVEVNGRFKAYPVDKLKRGETITDTVGGKTVNINVDKLGSVRILDKQTDLEISWQISFWFSWAAFHPDTEVF